MLSLQLKEYGERRKHMDLNAVIVSPVITERSMQDASKNKYTFFVARAANKNSIKKAVEKKFSVTVLAVSTTTMKGKRIRTGTRRIEVKLSPRKKAMVQVKNGQKIALFDIKA